MPEKIDISEEFLWQYSYNKLKEIKQLTNRVMRKKYKVFKGVKYGNINKGFTEAELRHFLGHILLPEEEKYYIAFLLMAYLGLRSGEAVRVKLEDINFEKKSIRISTEKSGKNDYLYLHNRVRIPLENWVRKTLSMITQKNGYVLFSNNKIQPREHLSACHLRNKFREICRRAGLTEWYAEGEDKNNPTCRNGNRKLYRLSTHSLRHFYITQVYRSTLDPITTSKLARHSDLSSTQIYIHSAKETLDEGMKKTFERID